MVAVVCAAVFLVVLAGPAPNSQLSAGADNNPRSSGGLAISSGILSVHVKALSVFNAY